MQLGIFFFGEKETSTNRNTVIEGVVLIQGFGVVFDPFSGGAQSRTSGSGLNFFRETSR